MKTVSVAAWLVVAGASMPALAQHLPPSGGPYPPPFTATLSNNTPLAFGMDAEGAARALGTPLNYISGRPGDEIYLTFRNIGGSGLFPQEGPALSAIPQRPAGRLERRLGSQLDVAITSSLRASTNLRATSNKNG